MNTAQESLFLCSSQLLKDLHKRLRLLQRSAKPTAAFVALSSLIFLFAQPGLAQGNTVSAQESSPATLRISVAWWGEQMPEPAPQTTMILRSLDAPGREQTITVNAEQGRVLKVARGRYQLTTTQPLLVNGQSYGWDLELPVTEGVNDVELSLSNAVVLNAGGQPASAAAGESGPNPPSVKNNKEVHPIISAASAQPASEATRTQISALLDKWIDSVKTKNLQEQMSCYAPVLTTYFRKHNVPRSEIRADKERFFQRYPNIRDIRISDMHITGSEQPEAIFLKTWNFGGVNSDWNGQVISHLTFAQENGRWVISSERERLVQVDVPFH